MEQDSGGREKTIRVGVVCVLRCEHDHLLLEVTDPGSGGKFFIPAGGEVNFSELARDAVIRTVEEDIGVKVETPTLLGVLESRIMFDGTPQHEIMFCFGTDVDIVTKNSITPESIKAKGRTVGIRWLSRSDIKEFDGVIVPEGLADLILTPINDPKVPKPASVTGQETSAEIY